MTAWAPSLEAALPLAPVGSLAMYDPPEVHAANDALWTAIADHLRLAGVDAPRTLTRDADLDAVWRAPNLLLAQTCGYPLTRDLRGLVQVVATPRYLATGCTGAFYRSLIVTPAGSPARVLEDLRGSRVAINDRRSNSGMNLLRAQIAPLARDGRFFGAVEVTGSHLASLGQVAAGAADIAAIDTVSFTLAARAHPELEAAVRILGWTRASPGLPLITAASTPPEVVRKLRRALAAAETAPWLADARRALRLDGFTVLPDHLYDQIPYLEAAATARGYPELA